MAVFHVTRG